MLQIKDFIGDITLSSSEGNLEWIKVENLSNIKQFEQNEKFIPYLFKDEIFEAKFTLGEKSKVDNYEIRKI